MQSSKNKSSTWSMIGATGTLAMVAFSFIPKEFLDKNFGKGGRIFVTASIVSIGVTSILSFIKSWTIDRAEKYEPSQQKLREINSPDETSNISNSTQYKFCDSSGKESVTKWAEKISDPSEENYSAISR